jgi:hypothetical protein
MITAQDAFIKTKYQKQIDALLKECEEEIEFAINKGRYSTCVRVGFNIPKTVKDRTLQTLADYGYKCTITNYNETEKNVPSDQCHYYDDLTIKWEG